MVSNLKSAGNGETGTDVEAIMTDLASLRDGIAALTKHVSNNTYGASSAAADKIGAEATKAYNNMATQGHAAAEKVGAKATRAYNNMAAQGQRSAKMISHQVEEQPLATLLIAFALGFIGSRMLQR